MKQKMIITIGVDNKILSKVDEIRKTGNCVVYHFGQSVKLESLNYFMTNSTKHKLETHLIITEENPDTELIDLCLRLGVTVHAT